jgi:hypothetical protein
MPIEILGLPSSDKFQALGDRFNDHRRKILHSYPNGKAPLTGILSLLPEEVTNDAIYIWYEKRYQSPKTTMRGTARLTKTAPSTGDADDGTAADTGATTIATTLYMKVASTQDFKIGQIVRTDTTGVLFRVNAITRGVADPTLLGYLTVNLVRAATFGTVANDFPNGGIARIIGSAYGEGASGSNVVSTGFKRPYRIENTTQIFRDSFTFPGSVLKMGLKYDKEGPYKEKAKDTVVDHMTSIERSLLWGRRSTTSLASYDSNQENLSVRTFSGIIEFLELWNAGSDGLSIDGATYAPYNFKPATTSDTDDDCRIIANASGTISVNKFNVWAERVGRYHTNKTNEKLVLIGSGALIALTELFRRNSTFQVKVGEKAYGLSVTQIITPFGTFNLVTHPLFNEDPVMTYWMLFLDVWNLKYRYLTDRDTRLLTMRQNPGDDFRKDEFLTECGLELWQPESHMLVKNVRNYSET